MFAKENFILTPTAKIQLQHLKVKTEILTDRGIAEVKTIEIGYPDEVIEIKTTLSNEPIICTPGTYFGILEDERIYACRVEHLSTDNLLISSDGTVGLVSIQYKENKERMYDLNAAANFYINTVLIIKEVL